MNKSDTEYVFMTFTSENTLTSLWHLPRSGKAVFAAYSSHACIQIPGKRQSKGRTVHLASCVKGIVHHSGDMLAARIVLVCRDRI